MNSSEPFDEGGVASGRPSISRRVLALGLTGIVLFGVSLVASSLSRSAAFLDDARTDSETVVIDAGLYPLISAATVVALLVTGAILVRTFYGRRDTTRD